MQVTSIDPGLTNQPDSQSPGENGQSHRVRQLLTRSSAPAGSQAAARAAMLPDSFHDRLRLRPGQQLHNLPECGQVSGMLHCIVGSVQKTPQSKHVLIAIHCLLRLKVALSHIFIHHSWHSSGTCLTVAALDASLNPCQVAWPTVSFCLALGPQQ